VRDSNRNHPLKSHPSEKEVSKAYSDTYRGTGSRPWKEARRNPLGSPAMPYCSHLLMSEPTWSRASAFWKTPPPGLGGEPRPPGRWHMVLLCGSRTSVWDPWGGGCPGLPNCLLLQLELRLVLGRGNPSCKQFLSSLHSNQRQAGRGDAHL
jgi:hypothetical protein